jgi:subtilisin family serine protease
MNRLPIILLVLSIFSLSLPTISQPTTFQQEYEPGLIHVKLKEKNGRDMKLPSKAKAFGIQDIDKMTAEIKTTSVRRIFPEAGKYEQAHRQFGLHLWYEIQFDPQVPVSQALNKFKRLDFFEYAESVQKYTRIGTEESAPNRNHFTPPASTNDLLYGDQWYLNNTGQTGGLPGADIKIEPAWDIERGKTNVIVGIIDGGIDIDHPDLRDALWVNPGEIPGNGIDDDNNGYVDDVHGYNFIAQKPELEAEFHGTHVAGVIGAVSNNNTGIAGIAGGTGSGDGVRLMSLQVFLPGNVTGGFGMAEAMVYAADNGAVISQNSWGGGSRVIEAAIDYFRQRAGFDNTSGNFHQKLQIGPLAGGLVIFAAGNGSSSNPQAGYPSSYPGSMAIASTDHNDKKSPFSNFGDWIDLAAPGSSILSTFPLDLGNYSLLSGTSMACPQVSGVAALIVSKFGGADFRPEQVRGRLIAGADNVNRENAEFVNQLGSGRLNAYQALALEPGSSLPNAITTVTVKNVRLNQITVTWTSTGNKGINGEASALEWRYSTLPIDETNFNAATPVVLQPLPAPLNVEMNLTVNDLQFNTTYYLAMRVMDIAGNYSSISNVLEVSTNPYPEIIVSADTMITGLTSGEIVTKYLTITNRSNDEINIGFQFVGHQKPEAPRQSRLFQFDRRNLKIIEVNTEDGSFIRSIPVSFNFAKSGGFVSAYDGRHLYLVDRSLEFTNAINLFRVIPETGELVSQTTLKDPLVYIFDMISLGNSLIMTGFSDFSFQRKTIEIDASTGTTIRTIEFDETVSDAINIQTFSGSFGTWLGLDLESFTTAEFNPASGRKIRDLPIEPRFYSTLKFSESANALFLTEYDYETFTEVLVKIDYTTWEFIREYPLTDNNTIATDEYGWLAIQPGWEIFQPGETKSIPVHYIGTSLPGGVYLGDLRVYTDYQQEIVRSLAVGMNVAGAIAITPSQEQLDFGKVVMGEAKALELILTNVGDGFTVTAITLDNDAFTTSTEPFSLINGASRKISVSFQGENKGEYTGSLKLMGETGMLYEIAVRGIIASPPALTMSNQPIEENMSVRERKTRTIPIANTGEADLEFSVAFKPTQHPGKAPWKKGRLFTMRALGENELKAIELSTTNGSIINTLINSLFSAFAFDGEHIYGSTLHNGKSAIRKINPVTQMQDGLITFDELGYIAHLTHSGKYIYAGTYDWLYEIDFDRATILRKFDVQSLQPAYAGSQGSLLLAAPYSFDNAPIPVYELNLYTEELTLKYSLPNTYSYLGGSINYSEGLQAIVQYGFINDFTGQIKVVDPDNMAILNTITNPGGIINTVATDGSGWITIGHVRGRVQQGETFQLPLYFHTLGDFSGLYEGELRITTNDPNRAEITLPVSLDVFNIITSVDEPVANASIEQYPNPIANWSALRYQLATEGLVTISVHDALGKKVATIVDESQPAGNHQVEWETQNLQHGLYFYRLEFNGRTIRTGKMIKH